MIRNLILDWSGTLVDDLLPVVKTTNHVLEFCGLPPMTLDQFRAEFCLPVRKFYETRVTHIPQAKLEEVFLTEYPKHHNAITVLPHTMDFLRFCRERGFGAYIASTVDLHTFETQMERFGLNQFINRSYIGIEDKTTKIHQILDDNHLDRDETMFVGDMEHDIEAGRAGGIHTCAVLTGYNPREKLEGMEPDLICENLGELQHFLVEQEVAHG